MNIVKRQEIIDDKKGKVEYCFCLEGHAVFTLSESEAKELLKLLQEK